MKLLELDERELVRRLDLEDLLEGRRRLVVVLDLGPPNLGDLEQLTDLLRRLLERLRASHLDADDVGPTILGTVELLELRHSLEVRRIDLEELSPRFGGVVRLFENGAVGFAELPEETFQLLGIEERASAVDRRVQGADELGRVFAPPPNRGDGTQCRDVREVDVEYALPGVQRFRVPAEPIREEPGAARECIHPIFVGLRDVEVPLEDVGELSPALLLLVQVRECKKRLRIFPAEVQDPLPSVDGLFDVAETIRRNVRELRSYLGFLDVADGVLELPRVDDLEVDPGFLRLEDPRERADRVLVVRLELIENSPIRHDRVVDTTEFSLVDLAEAPTKLDLFALVRRDLCALFENPGELRVLLRGGIDSVEIREAFGVLRRHREHEAVRLFRLLNVGELFLEDSGEPSTDGAKRLRLQAFDAHHVRIGVRELFPAAFDHPREALDFLAGLLVERPLTERAYVNAEGLDRIHQTLLGVLRDAVIHLDPLVRLRDRGELRFVNADQLFPFAGGLIERLQDLTDLELLHPAFEQAFERAQGLCMLGGRADHLAVRRYRLVDVIQAKLIDAAEPVFEL